jgi:hypothetical protein
MKQLISRKTGGERFAEHGAGLGGRDSECAPSRVGSVDARAVQLEEAGSVPIFFATPARPAPFIAGFAVGAA